MKKNKPQKNIPNGWSQVKLGDICIFKKGKGLPKSDLTDDGKYEAIHYGELFTKYNEKISKILSSTNNNENVFLSKKNDILMPTSDVTPRGLSTASFIDKDGVILGGDILVIRPKINELNGLFFSNFVTAQKKEIIKLVSGTTVFHLYGSDMAKLKFNMPSLFEQKRIVAVLEVWDEVVDKLARKIEIKKNIKKGLMQELLGKKKRLSGFNKKWELFKLKDLCVIKKGQQLNRDDMVANGIYPALNGGTEPSGYTNEWNTKENTITISEGGNSCGFVNFNQEKFWCGGHCYAVSPNKNTDKLFFYQVLKSKQKRIMSLRVGSGLPNIQKNSLDDLKILFPEDVKEQKAIAGILVTADREIEKLEEKLRIIKEQKKFLLNNLITGQIRVPVGNE